MRPTTSSLVVRAALAGGLCLAAFPALAAAQKGGRTNKTANSDAPVETMSNTIGRKVRADLDEKDPIDFLLKRDKQLTLTSAQKDSLKSLHKQLDEEQKPIFKELQRVLTEADREATMTGGRGSPPPVMRDLVGRLNEVQAGYSTKAKAQLNASQTHIADSLQTIYAAELAAKAEKENKGGRRGG